MFCLFTDHQFGPSVVSFLRDHPFHFYRAGHFSPSFNFSKAHIELTPQPYYTTAAKLFGMMSVQQFKEKLAAMPESANKLFTLFESTSTDFSFATHKMNEKETFKLISESILQKLGEVVLDKHQFGAIGEDEYKPPSLQSASSSRSASKITSDWLGVGTFTTWHGYPDGRFRINDTSDVLLLLHDDSEEEGSPGNTIAIEAKLNINADKLMQLVPTSVVVAFVENNLIPTIMISPTRAVICIYDVQKDFLLLSDTFQWLEKVGDTYTFDKAGFVLLWMTLNHR